MSYHRDLTREIAALDDLIENQLKRLDTKASPEQAAILNELKQILTLKKELLRKLIIEAKPNQQQRDIGAARYLSDDIQ
jgi:ribosomal protein S6